MKIFTTNQHEPTRLIGRYQKISSWCLCGSWLIFTIFLLCAIPVSGQQQADRPWWYTLEAGKYLFRSGAYGDALITFEDARRDRIAQFTRMEQDMILLMSTPDVRRLGDSLDFIEKYIADRRETRAAAALAELYYRLPKDSLNGSAKRALEELNRLKSFPEAEYWLGETYRAEGELVLALRQYERAWESRSLLETPGFDAEILYRITDIHRMRQEYRKWKDGPMRSSKAPIHRALPETVFGPEIRFGPPWPGFWKTKE